MRVRGCSAVLMVSLSLAGGALVGCGGSKPKSSGSVSGSAAHGSGSGVAAATSAGTGTRSPAGTAVSVKYHAGQLCSRQNTIQYAEQGLVCITGRLHPPEVRYRKGEFCSGRTNALYTRQHLQCVRGRLTATK